MIISTPINIREKNTDICFFICIFAQNLISKFSTYVTKVQDKKLSFVLQRNGV